MTGNQETKCVCVRVQGHVQGVGFRQWVRKMARQRSISGWVMNHSDGTVEAIIQGSAQHVHRMIELVSTGPPGAEVAETDVKWIDPQSLPGPFEIRRS